MAVEYKDYYKLLGVSRGASKDEISKAFKKLARKYHPDMNQGDKSAEGKFKDINEAYEVLKDDEKRRLYDELGPNWQHGQQFNHQDFGRNFGQSFGGGFSQHFGGRGGAQSFDSSSFSDFFETLFGGGARQSGRQSASFGGDPFASFSRQPRKGRDVDASVQLTLEDAYHGGVKSISLQTSSGVRTLEVKIPAGVKSGARIRLAGQGEPGQGAAPGDLYLAVTLMPHALFSLDDNDVVYELPIAPWEAVLGAKVRVPTLDGEVDLTIPPGSGSQRKFRLRGRGLGSGTTKGDQFVRIAVAVPPSLTAEEKEVWEKLQAISPFTAR